MDKLKKYSVIPGSTKVKNNSYCFLSCMNLFSCVALEVEINEHVVTDDFM